MTDQEFIELLTSESDRVEHKRQLKNAEDAIAQTICAFANDLPNYKAPGVIVVGMEDNGSCSNLTIDDDLLKRLSEYRSNISPFPVIAIRRFVLSECVVAIITTEASSDVPLRYKGIVYVRVGPTTRMASPEEERRLVEKRRAGNRPFDLSTVPDTSLNDLDIVFFEKEYLQATIAPEVVRQNQRSASQKLLSLRMIQQAEGDEPSATVVGLLTLGFDPTEFLPGAYIQFLRIDGESLTDPIRDEKKIDGPINQLLQRLDEVLQLNISVQVNPLGATEDRRPDYPIDALRQMVRNAVMHRVYEGTNAPIRIYWFSDRIEVHSPGGPYGQVTEDNFGQPGITDYRNPHVAEVMKNLGYVQRFGMGFQIASEQLARNGNPPMEMDVQPTFVLIVLRRTL